MLNLGSAHKTEKIVRLAPDSELNNARAASRGPLQTPCQRFVSHLAMRYAEKAARAMNRASLVCYSIPSENLTFIYCAISRRTNVRFFPFCERTPN